MATLAVRLTTLQALNATQRQIVRWICARLELHSIDCRFTAPGGNVWVVSDDDRITLDDVAVFGCVAANLGLLANQVNLPEGDQLRQQVRAFVASRVVWPSAISYPAGSNPYAVTLAAQGAPASVQAADSVPATWVPV